MIGLVDNGEWSDGRGKVGSVGDEFIDLDIRTIGPHCINFIAKVTRHSKI